MKKAAAFLLLFLVCLSGCSTEQPTESEIFAMDTLMQIKVWGEEADLQAVTAEVNRLEKALSVTAENSVLALLNRDGTAVLPTELSQLLAKAIAFGEATDGAFDITVRPLMLAWGFTQSEQHIPDDTTLTGLLPSVGTAHIQIDAATVQLDEGTQLDFGGIAKGYAGESCAKLLKQRGVCAALLNFGGNVQTVGSKPDGSAWLVGIADPNNPDHAIATLTFYGEKALVTSGNYQRYFEQNGVRYGHILDPKTGKPIQNGLASVTVIAESGTLADAFSTALYVMGQEQAVTFWRERQDFEAVFVTENGEIFATQGADPLLKDCEFTVIAR